MRCVMAPAALGSSVCTMVTGNFGSGGTTGKSSLLQSAVTGTCGAPTRWSTITWNGAVPDSSSMGMLECSATSKTSW